MTLDSTPAAGEQAQLPVTGLTLDKLALTLLGAMGAIITGGVLARMVGRRRSA